MSADEWVEAWQPWVGVEACGTRAWRGHCLDFTWLTGSDWPLPMVRCLRMEGHTREHFARDSRDGLLYVWRGSCERSWGERGTWCEVRVATMANGRVVGSDGLAHTCQRPADHEPPCICDRCGALAAT